MGSLLVRYVAAHNCRVLPVAELTYVISQGIGALIAIPCIKAHSFAGFVIAIAVVGSGLGSLETAANPYITGKN
jgi:fucose permease